MSKVVKVIEILARPYRCFVDARERIPTVS
jgi:hypothetical protein